MNLLDKEPKFVTKKAVSIVLATALSLVNASAFAESCVPKYEAQQAKLYSNAAKEGASGVGAATLTIGTFILASTGVGLVVLAVGAGGTVFYVFTKKDENANIRKELSVLTLYNEAKEFVTAHKTKLDEMKFELYGVVTQGLDELAKKPLSDEVKLQIPKAIVELMESGVLCSGGKLATTEDLLRSLSVTRMMEPKVVPMEVQTN